MRLQVLTTYFNPMNYKNRHLRYLEFERHMLESDVDLWVVEQAEPGKHILSSSSIHHIPVSAKTVCWQKESQLQIGLEAVPKECEYIGFFDADIVFKSSTWARDAVSILQDHDIASAWEFCEDLDAFGVVAEVHHSFGAAVKAKKPILQGAGLPHHGRGRGPLAHPGYAWISRRDFLEHTGGFLDTAILGSGDHHMALSLLGLACLSAPANITRSYMNPIYAWQEKALAYGPRIGFVPGTISHGYHGSKKNRAYLERWEVLVKHDFNPKLDLVRNEHGVVELAGNKPALAEDIWKYFQSRQEDGMEMEKAR